MPYKTLATLSQELTAKHYSSREITEFYLQRIQQHDQSLNSFITVTAEQAIASAIAADERRAKGGEHHPLLGVPIAHKDIFCTQGVKTTCGSKMLDNFISPYDAQVVERCQQVGMVTLGKTNMDEFAMGSSNETSFYGSVKNPWDLQRVPGGSSGGSAAAVAAGLAPISTGTDTGGSIRQPAALCGITGLKPTYGRVSRYGMIAFASSLDQAGILALSAEDCAILLSVMAGYDARDSTCIPQSVPDYTATLPNSLQGLRIGLPKEYFANGNHAEVNAAVDQVIQQYKQMGVQFREISLPNTSLAVSTYYVVAPAECSSNLARFDGVRYGYQCQNPVDLLDLYERTRSEGFGDEVKRRIMIGTYVLSAGYYDAYYLQAQRIRQIISDEFRQAFTEVDLILSPSTPSPAFKLGEKSTDPVSMYLSDVYTIPANLAGLPALSMPAGFAEQLPVGVQLIGPHFSEEKLLHAAHQYQLQTDWHKKNPLPYSY